VVRVVRTARAESRESFIASTNNSVSWPPGGASHLRSFASIGWRLVTWHDRGTRPQRQAHLAGSSRLDGVVRGCS